VINEIGLFIQQQVAADPAAMRSEQPRVPWQYRSALEWWPDVVPNHAEARLMQRFAERSGGPTLEVGFGSGQRLLACRAAGHDIDGVETSRGLYLACRERFAARGHLGHRLYLQPLHEIDLPRRYQSIYAGRVFGTGASPEADALGLWRLHRALEPGGSLLIDHPSALGHSARWTIGWRGARRRSEPVLESFEIRSPSGSDILQLSSRVFEHVPETASLSYTVCARLFEQGELRRSRGVALRQRFYTHRQVAGLLRRAGFDERRIAVLPGAGRNLWIAEKAVSPPAHVNRLGPIGLAGALAMRAHNGAW
jgi:hypothetical protein